MHSETGFGRRSSPVWRCAEAVGAPQGVMGGQAAHQLDVAAPVDVVKRQLRGQKRKPVSMEYSPIQLSQEECSPHQSKPHHKARDDAGSRSFTARSNEQQTRCLLLGRYTRSTTCNKFWWRSRTSCYMFCLPFAERGGYFPWGEARQRRLYTSKTQKDTPGTPLPIGLQWLECPHK